MKEETVETLLSTKLDIINKTESLNEHEENLISLLVKDVMKTAEFKMLLYSFTDKIIKEHFPKKEKEKEKEEEKEEVKQIIIQDEISKRLQLLLELFIGQSNKTNVNNIYTFLEKYIHALKPLHSTNKYYAMKEVINSYLFFAFPKIPNLISEDTKEGIKNIINSSQDNFLESFNENETENSTDIKVRNIANYLLQYIENTINHYRTI